MRLLTLLAGAVAWRHAGRAGRPLGRFDAVALWLLVVESTSFAGHAGHGSMPLVATTLDALHLTATATWFGGLVVLAAAVLRPPARAATRVAAPVAVTVGAGGGGPVERHDPHRPDPGDGELSAVLARWSVVATTSVATIALTGAVAAVRDVGSVPALWGTDYGRLVAVKVFSFAVVLLVAAGSHRTVRRWSTAAADAFRLRRLVLTETAVVAVVVGVSAALVTTAPAAETYRPSFETAVTGTASGGGRIALDVLVRPTTPGFEGLTVHASDPSGRAVPVEVATVSLLNRGTGIGPIEFPAPVTPGQGVEDTLVSVPGPGRWEVSMRLRVGGEWYSATTSYDVG